MLNNTTAIKNVQLISVKRRIQRCLQLWGCVITLLPMHRSKKAKEKMCALQREAYFEENSFGSAKSAFISVSKVKQ